MVGSDYPPFAVTVDLVILTVRSGRFAALVVERGEDPFRGRLALPGGFVRPDEDLPDAALRELREETGLAPSLGHLEQLASYGAPRRDPRQRVVSVAYLGLVPDLPEPVAGTDAAASRFVPVAELLRDAGSLAFDHGRILSDGVERARAKLEYTSLATAFCPAEFTVGELRAVYEAVWGVELDPRNFHRKVTGTPGFLEPTNATTTRGGGRPAQLYRRGPTTALMPPILRT
ncbi:NUDIX hydrolase [Jiangella alkaliphila]|uniref:8-oxo-dGTP diphosphatase n=1 Tax=Jiangella alkaliphila TaxID=419479 RepID=A0A1H2H748_9ACTN|nr:NUDIX domain-containing protein [Jiangella alkaliphila]SDU27388.1 8-oxo-dGTP diphosphatase [Jiangella alkaliphila]